MNGVALLFRSPVLRAGSARCALAAALVALGGCSQVTAQAWPSSGALHPRHEGAVALYASGKIPAGARELGAVEVRGASDDGDIRELLPEFVNKVASIGGDSAVIASVRAEFAIVTQMVTSYSGSCGGRMRCSSIRTYPVYREVMIVTMQGYAYRRAP